MLSRLAPISVLAVLAAPALAQPSPPSREAKVLPVGTKVALARPTDGDEVLLRLVGIRCVAATKLTRNSDGTFDGQVTCGAVTIKAKRLALEVPGLADNVPSLGERATPMTDARVERGEVTILGLGPSDLFAARARELVGKVCSVTQPLVRDAQGYYAGELLCGGARYYFAAVSVAAGAVAVPAEPSPPAPSSGPQVGERWRIVDAGDVYPSINTTDCLVWPNPEAKRKGGEGFWGAAYAPHAGDTGVVLGRARHCNQDLDVIFLQIGAYVVPVGEKGLERAP
jgi:hypothetical protein